MIITLYYICFEGNLYMKVGKIWKRRKKRKNARIIDSAKLAAVGLFFSQICGNEKKVVKLENPLIWAITAKLILHLNLVKKKHLCQTKMKA